MHGPRTRRSLTIGVLMGTVLLAACLSKSITKEQAGVFVQASAAFTRPKFAHIPRQLTFQSGFASPYGNEGILSISDLARVDPTLAILKLSHAVNVSESIYGPGRGAMHQLVVTPVDIDSASLLADEDPHAAGFDEQENMDAQEERSRTVLTSSSQFKKELGWRVPIGTRQFLQVERIHNWKDANENIPVNELAVDFSWRWVPNEFGDAFDSGSETFRSFPDSVQESAKSWGVRMNTESSMLSRAYLHRVGDKWQLRLIRWSIGQGNPR
ncbi:MAG TPA: hypothetical protein VJN70_03365 [Gemmatimonadaceae bacterium]|nr:hypothetical protein [Gemmatimonadaceae bacterium]